MISDSKSEKLASMKNETHIPICAPSATKGRKEASSELCSWWYRHPHEGCHIVRSSGQKSGLPMFVWRPAHFCTLPLWKATLDFCRKESYPGKPQKFPQSNAVMCLSVKLYSRETHVVEEGGTNVIEVPEQREKTATQLVIPDLHKTERQWEGPAKLCPPFFSHFIWHTRFLLTHKLVFSILHYNCGSS